jgi:hypothetical protein
MRVAAIGLRGGSFVAMSCGVSGCAAEARDASAA